MEYRTTNKFKSNHLDNTGILEINGIIHPNHNVYFTSTGRLSSGKE
jgi:DNA polymerase I-like protein with 3'-5' exonuclease and polymerase domains